MGDLLVQGVLFDGFAGGGENVGVGSCNWRDGEGASAAEGDREGALEWPGGAGREGDYEDVFECSED